MLYCFDKLLPWDYSKREMAISKMNQNGILYDNKLKVFTDFDGNIIDIKSKLIFPRTGETQIHDMNDEIIKQGGIPIMSNNDVEIVKSWPNYYSTERKCKIFKGKDLINPDIGKEIEEVYGKEIFFKTKAKNFSAVIPVKLLLDEECALHKTLMHHLEDDFIISKKVNIAEDNYGSKEYRCFVVNNEIYNISRYTTTILHSIEPEVLEFAESIVEKLKGIFPDYYVLDLFEYQIEDQSCIDVLEFNPIQAAGLYLYSSCMKKSNDILHEKTNNVSYEFIDKIDKCTTNGVISSEPSNHYDYPNGFSNHLRSICFNGDIGTSFVQGLHLSSKDFASHEPIFNPTNAFCIEDDFFSKLKPFEPKNLCDENEEKPKIMVKENKNY